MGVPPRREARDHSSISGNSRRPPAAEAAAAGRGRVGVAGLASADLGPGHRRRARRVRRRRPDLAPEGVPARRGPGRAQPAHAGAGRDARRAGRAGAGGPHLHAAPLRPGHPHPRDSVPAARDRPRLRVGAAGQAGRQARGGRRRAAGSPSSRPPTTGGSPPTSPPSRPSARCSRRCRRRRRPTSTSRSTARTTRSSSPPRPRPRSAGITAAARTRSGPSWPTPPARRRSPTAPASGWPARPPRCATSAATSSPSATCRRPRW